MLHSRAWQWALAVGSSAGAVDWSTYTVSMWLGLLIVGQLGSQGSCPKRPGDKGEAAF